MAHTSEWRRVARTHAKGDIIAEHQLEEPHKCIPEATELVVRAKGEAVFTELVVVNALEEQGHRPGKAEHRANH